MSIHEANAPTAAVPIKEKALRASWYALLVLTFINSCHYLDRTVVSIVIEPIRKEFLLTDGQLGLLTGMAYGLTFALAGLPLGYLVDRVNRRNLLVGLVVVWSGFTALAGFAQSFVHLLLARMGVGAAEAGGSPTSMSIIADLFPPKLRSTAMGAFFLSMAIGGAISAFIGSYVAVHHGWRAAFFIAGIPGVLCALLFLTTVREPARGGMDAAAKQPDVTPGVLETLRFVKGQRALVHLLFAMPLSVMAISAISAWLVAFFMRGHGLELKDASILAGINFGVFAALGSIAGGLLSDRLGRQSPRRRIAFAGIACLVGVPLTLGAVLVLNTSVAVAFWFALSVCAFATIPPAFGSLVSLVKPRMRGITLSLIQVVTNLIGYGVAPYLTGVLSDWYGGPQSLRYALLTVIGVTLVWAMAHFLLAARNFERDAARASEF